MTAPRESRFDVVVQGPDRCVVMVKDAASIQTFYISRAEVADLGRVFQAAAHEMDHAVLDVKGGIIAPGKA